MANNLFDEKKQNDLFAGITQDEELDLHQFIRPANVSKEQKVNTGEVSSATRTVDDITKTEIQSLSPLEQELANKKARSLGMNITKEEYEKGLERAELFPNLRLIFLPYPDYFQ